MKKETLKGLKRNARQFKAPPTKVHSERRKPLFNEFVEWEPNPYCADCGCRLHVWMERFETLDGDICEDCLEAIVEG